MTEDGSNVRAARVWFKSTSVECFVGFHREAAVLAAFVVVLFVVGFPVSSFLYVRR
jgi:hypothetical protein